MAPDERVVCGVNIRWGEKIPTRDDVQLNATIYLPDRLSGCAPAIALFTPYVAQRHDHRAKYFASRGYPFVAVDVRGRGNSEGVFHPLNEAQDCHDAIEWIAEQPFCNGKVALWGGSYSGYAQWAATRNRSPHLTTIIPIAAPYRGLDSPIQNNVFTPYTIRWLALVAGKTAQDALFADDAWWAEQFRRALRAGIPFREFDGFMGFPSPLFQEWLQHPMRDDYWDSYNPSQEELACLDIPVLTITGAYDGDQLGALEHYRQHVAHAPSGRNTHHIIIGPWDHAGCGEPQLNVQGLPLGPASVVDLQALQLAWYDWTTRDAPKPAFFEKAVAYYVTGDECWQYVDALEDATARDLTLHLHAASNPTDVFHSGHLQTRPPNNAPPAAYIYDPCDLALLECEAPALTSIIDQRMVHARQGRSLIYHSEPLDEALLVAGFFRFEAWLELDQPDTDLSVSVFEISVSGQSVLLSSAWLRARHRDSPRRAEPASPGKPQHYRFDNFNFVARRLAKRSRLRLTLGPLDSIHWQRNYNTGGDVSDETPAIGRIVRVQLHHSPPHASSLHVPIGREPLRQQARPSCS